MRRALIVAVLSAGFTVGSVPKPAWVVTPDANAEPLVSSATEGAPPLVHMKESREYAGAKHVTRIGPCLLPARTMPLARFFHRLSSEFASSHLAEHARVRSDGARGPPRSLSL